MQSSGIRLMLASLLIALAMLGASHWTAQAGPAPVIIHVNDTGDASDSNTADGVCSTGTVCTLRAALEQATAGPLDGVPVDIEFSIQAAGNNCTAGVCTITPATALPAIDDSAVTRVLGFSQLTQQPTNCTQFAGALGPGPCIVIDGGGGAFDGLTITSDNNFVEGLAIIHFAGNGIKVTGNKNTIQKNYIGIAADGSTGGAGNKNTKDGIEISASDNVIGRGNVISNNGDAGVDIQSGDRNKIIGDLIGTTASGLGALGNSVTPASEAGVEVRDATDTVIGGTTLADRNVISATIRDEGIETHSDANRTDILGNIIGLGIDGSTTLGNEDGGIEIDSNHEQCVGGLYVLGVCTPAAGALLPNGSAGNLISGNTCVTGGGPGCDGDGDGIEVDGGTGSHKFFGNFIGTDLSGTACRGNRDDGIDINTSSSDNNVIGGTDVHAGNLISCNSGTGDADGVMINSGSTGNLVTGNIIGLNRFGAATGGFGNERDGVKIDGDHNCVGGDTAACTSDSAASRNLISRNGRHGVKIDDADFNVVRGNFIGTDITGAIAAGNGDDGVNIDPSDNNTIGPNNVISANVGDGVQIDGDSNVVKGNKIGTDATGTVDLGNGTNGVLITVGPGADSSPCFVSNPGSSFNVIGGTAAADRNIISGNGLNGVFLDGGTAIFSPVNCNSVLGNYIGTDVTGTAAIPNDEDGVKLRNAFFDNCIGGLFVPSPQFACTPQIGTLPTGLAGNVISGNGRAGFGPDTNGDNGIEFISAGPIGNPENLLNSVISNFIGLDATGLKALGNRDNGILDNSFVGVECIGSSFILNGCTPVSGVINGRNVISGNGKDGIKLTSTGGTPPFPVANIIITNYIGTNYQGVACTPTPCGNGDDGVDLDPVQGNVLGGNAAKNPLVRNVISGNGFPTCVDATNGCNGIEISGEVGPPLTITTSFNFVQGNFIGTTANGSDKLGNRNDGILIRNGAQFNLVGVGSSGSDRLASCTDPAKNLGFGNVIAYNGGAGVHVDGGQTFSNTIRCNSIHDNVGKGIALTNGANNGILPPTVTATSTIDGTANVGSTVDGYNDNNGEGQTVIGQANPNTLFNCDGAGICQFTILGSNPLPNATATQTDNLGDTSEFSNSLTTLNCVVTATASATTLKFSKHGYKTIKLTVQNQGILAAQITGIAGLIADNLSVKQIKFGKKTLLPPFNITLPPATQQFFTVKLQSSVKQTVSAPFVNVVGNCNGFDFNAPGSAGDELGLISALVTPLKLEQLSLKTQAGQLVAAAQGVGIQSVQLQVYDTTGRLLTDQMAQGAKLVLATERQLANGVYLAVMTVRGQDGQTVRSELKKFVIQR